MLRADLIRRVVEIDKVPAADIDGTDTEAHRARIDQVEIHQSLERRSQRRNVVIAQRLGRTVRIEKGRRDTRLEKSGGAANKRAQRAYLIDESVGELVPAFQRSEKGHPERRGTDGFPERAQPLDALFWRIAGNKRRVDRTDRDAGHPIRMQIRLSQRLIDAGLVGAERTAALQD